ncbi:hypothetical protein RN001_000822 [Aquatica leii]|uniref:Succinate dehydrogenase [ubiquinone] cytochrome b small subunit n=1 Tax=Aquatica leii TaxID=1421715 RepID=A0AAN7SCF4_9COLE|nr:hypothetical protein RN001_000822 [Aquatica leii]
MSMALSVLLRNANRTQSYFLLSKSLSVADKNISSLSAIAKSRISLFNNVNKLVLNKNHISILPAVRHMSGVDHRTLWKVERVLSAGLVVLLPACIAFPCEMLDNLTAIAVVSHFHWGLVAIVQDYLRPVVVGRFIPPVAMALAYMITGSTLAGLIFFNYTDIGIGQFIRQVWSLKE